MLIVITMIYLECKLDVRPRSDGGEVFMFNIKKSVIACFMAIMLSIAGVAFTSTPAYAASGSVTCSTSQIVGLWIEVGGGRSGWAGRSRTNDFRVNRWWYNTQGKWWRAHVGCGGSQQHWGVTIFSNWTNRQGVTTISCSDLPGRLFCVAG